MEHASAGPAPRTLRETAQDVYSLPNAHPVQAIQDNWLRNELDTKHRVMANVYGAHMPMQIRMELDILSQVQRLPGLPSSRLGLETILGRDEMIDYEDFLGAPNDSEVEPPDMRAALEKKYGILPRSPVMGPAAAAAAPGLVPNAAAPLPKRAGVAYAQGAMLPS